MIVVSLSEAKNYWQGIGSKQSLIY